MRPSSVTLPQGATRRSVRAELGAGEFVDLRVRDVFLLRHEQVRSCILLA